MSSADDIRERILQGATQQFAQFGFRKTSVDEIAARAHVGKGTVYLHFSSKEVLFAEVVHRASDEMLGILESTVKLARTPEAKLQLFFKVRVTEIANRIRKYGLTDDAALEIIPMAKALRKEYLEREVQLLERILVEGRDAGRFEIEKPRLLAVGLVSLLTGIEITLVRMREPPEMNEALDEILAVSLRGLCSGARHLRSP